MSSMAEETPLAERVQQAVAGSRLARGNAYVLNATGGASDGGPGVKPPSVLVARYDYDKLKLLPEEHLKKEPNLEQREAAFSQYLKWGTEQLKKKDPFIGQCDDFAAATIAMLRAVMRLPEPPSVELCGAKFTIASGHAFVVVGRNGIGDVTDPSTWPAGAFVVDQWYAVQRQSEGVNAVKTVDGVFKDEKYFDWLWGKAKQRVSVIASFRLV